jgi:hypothetical protein
VTPDLLPRRLGMCRRLLPILEARGPDSSQILVKGEESWFGLEYQHSTKWNVTRDEVPIKVSQMIGTKMVMLTMNCGIDTFHIIDMMPPGSRFNTEHFLTQIMNCLLAKVFPKGRKSLALRLSVHLDSGSVVMRLECGTNIIRPLQRLSGLRGECCPFVSRVTQRL